MVEGGERVKRTSKDLAPELWAKKKVTQRAKGPSALTRKGIIGPALGFPLSQAQGRGVASMAKQGSRRELEVATG